MRGKFRVTYDIVTPESAEHGDVSDRGFVMPGEWHYSTMQAPLLGSDHDLSLREAYGLINGACVEDCGSWFVEVDGRDDYKTGATETRSFHPPDNITAASYDRLKKLFGC